MFGFGAARDLSQLDNFNVHDDELEEGFDLHSKNLFGASEVEWVVGENNDAKVSKNKNMVGVLNYGCDFSPVSPEKDKFEVVKDEDEV